MDLQEYYEHALSYEQYIELLDDNRDLHSLHYKKFSISDEMAHQLDEIPQMNILVLTEPWCGDSLALFPVVYKIAKHCKWGIKALRRDENPELMEQFLTNGGRAVPIFIFMKQDHSFMFRFGPRPKAAQDIFESHRQDINNGKIEKIEVIKKIRNFYAKDRGNSIYKELLQAIKLHM